MGFWDNAAPSLVHKSILDLYAQDADAWEKELERYADYRDGRSSVVGDTSKGYFKKRAMETDERFADRPKASVPLCRTIVDVHAEALAKNVSVDLESEVRGDKTAELWRAVDEHNDMGAYWLKLAGTLGTFGHAIARPVLHNDGTPQKALEFDSFSPLQARLIFESNTAGRSVPHFQGVTLFCGYSLENGDTLPWPVREELADQLDVKMRVEYISADRWFVWLDGKVTPESPHGDVWMPDPEGGTNPYGFIPATLFNGLETEEQRLGISDIHQSVYDVQCVSEIWSDTLYMHRMYVPIAVTKSDAESLEFMASGIGKGIQIRPDEDFSFAHPGLDFRNVLEPMSIAVELALANAKTPAMSVGLGHMFGSAARTVNTPSGVAKAMEWKSTERHAMLKRGPFTRGVKDLVHKSLAIMGADPPYGQGLKVNPNAKITVDYPGNIVPTSQAEELERIRGELLAGVVSHYQAIVDYRGWDKDRAARELDQMAAESRAALVEMGMKHIVDAVIERQGADIDAAVLERDKEKLFGGMSALASDETANKEEDELPGGKK
jgi:hypothetical protein